MQHHIMFLAPVFSCAIILYLQTARRRQFTDVSKDLQDVYRCLQIISFYDKRFQSAGRLYDVLSSILSLGDYQRFQHSKNGQGLFNATPESQQHEHSGSGETAPTYTDGVDSSGFDPSVSNLDSSVASDEPTPSTVNPNSGLHSDLELFNLANLINPEYWPMGSAPSGLASEPADDWPSFMALVDEVLHSVGNDIEMQ
ncbi:hypothetical protein BT96DRAFT_320017 [Gymnopus androsaceus JB14]|uniref:Fungal-type protein kinase domain-containing protein n=1 Tax=Gymnopus androsaceus JB14 TaxID=1447944 RepID=A0A6A4GYV8_9AGAR|nr:hypothetical protein BT96DRAFT_320017 [Gymnopus androsaceus JB14]